MLENRRAKHTRGFTLIEIMVAITLLTIILAIVYSSFSSVVMSIERTRAASERLKTTAFIVRGFTQNLAQATEGWLPGAAYRPYSEPAAPGTQQSNAAQDAGSGEMRMQFKGSLDRGPNGSTDTLTFASTAPMLGGGTLPGQIKLCTYRIEEEQSEDEAAGSGDEEPRKLLVLTETPWALTGAESTQNLARGKQGTSSTIANAIEKSKESADQQPVTRSVPIFGLDLAYFDGKKWVEEWDSAEAGRLPWSVRVRVKLDRPEDDEFAGASELDPEKDPGVLELFFGVPAGEGIHDAPPDYVRPSARGAKS
jgi:prepilin-type N-terminal cleavage/methylation domain-containing protein